MPDPTSPPRYAPVIPLPPSASVPGHGLSHPVNAPRGHLFKSPEPVPRSLDQLPDDPASRRRALAALLAADPRWLHALDLFNGGFYWEAHEPSKRGSPARSPNVRLSKRTGLVSWRAKPSLKTGVIHGAGQVRAFMRLIYSGDQPNQSW